jgi:hypothetical protein
MDEREVKNDYKTLQKNGEYTPYINNIERLKSTISPKQNIELKAILVGASKHEGALHLWTFKTPSYTKFLLDIE